MLENKNIIRILDLSTRWQSFLIPREIKSSIPIDIIVRTSKSKQVKERIRMSDFFINLMSN